MGLRSWLALVLVGCSGDEDTQPKDTGEADADTDSDTDTDTDTDADTDGPVTLLTEGYGHSAPEWGPIWWNWLYSMGPDANPVLDTADCDTNQTEAVFFLGPTYVGSASRTCTVPAGMPLFFPMDTIELDNHGPYQEYDASAEYLGSFVESFIAGAFERSLTIDGQTWDTAALAAFDGPYQTFVLTVPDIDPNFLDFLGFPHWSGDLDPAVCDGVWILIDPLPPGTHHISFHSSFPSYTIDVDYELTVQ
jgi:hypothetical protein